MKAFQKTLRYAVMLAVSVSLFACGDDNDEPSTPASKEIAGTYTGYYEMASQYFSGQYGIDQTVTITSATDGSATIVYNNGSSWTSTLTAVEVTKTSNGYTLVGSGKMSMASHGGSSSEYDCTLAGTISSDLKSYTLTYTLPSVMGGTTIAFTGGEVPAAKYLAGDYSGWSKFAFSYMPDGINYGDQSLTLTATSEESVTVTYNSDDLGSCEIAATVATSTDGYTLSGEGKFSMGMSGSAAKEYDCTLEGTISSDKTTYAITFTLPSVMGGSTILFQNGSVPVGE